MAKPQKNRFVRNCNLSERMFGFVVLTWWQGWTARQSHESMFAYETERAIKGLYTDPKVPPTRETITRLFHEIGDQLFKIEVCQPLVLNKFLFNRMDYEETIKEIIEETECYYELLTSTSSAIPESIRKHQAESGQTWSPFANVSLEILRQDYKRSNGFSKRSLGGRIARSILVGEALELNSTYEDAMTALTRMSLDLFLEYPLRKPLPLAGFPWIDAWNELKHRS